MPSASQPDTPEEEDAPEPDEPAPAPAQPAPQAPAAAAPEPEPAPEENASDAIAALKERLFSGKGAIDLTMRTRKEYSLANLTELLVSARMDDALEKFSCCRCDKCRKDIAAIALNLLPAHYVVADADELAELVKQSNSQTVAAAVVKAILRVRSNPRH